MSCGPPYSSEKDGRQERVHSKIVHVQKVQMPGDDRLDCRRDRAVRASQPGVSRLVLKNQQQTELLKGNQNDSLEGPQHRPNWHTQQVVIRTGHAHQEPAWACRPRPAGGKGVVIDKVKGLHNTKNNNNRKISMCLFRVIRMSQDGLHPVLFRHLVDNDAVAAAVGDGLVLLLGVADDAGAVRVIAAAGTATVELDALTLAGDAVALAGAGAAVRVGSAVAGEAGAGRGAVGAVGQGRAGGRDWGRAEVGEGILVDLGVAEAGSELLNVVLVVVGVQDVLVAAGSHGLGGLDLGDGERATLGDVGDGSTAALGVLGGRLAGGLAGGLGGRLGVLGRLGRGLASGDIEDVQLAASGGLSGGLDGRVVGDVVAINDVVVPVSLARLESGGLEAESALPGTRLGGGLVLGKRKLTLVAVPGAEEMDGLDAGGDAERERQLSGGHFDYLNVVIKILIEGACFRK